MLRQMVKDEGCHRRKCSLFQHSMGHEVHSFPEFSLIFAFHVLGYELLIKLLGDGIYLKVVSINGTVWQGLRSSGLGGSDDFGFCSDLGIS